MYIALGIIVFLALGTTAVLQHPAFGSLPKGERLERIRQSKNYRNGAFQNLEETSVMTSDKSMAQQFWSFLTNRPQNTEPSDYSVEAVKTDLSALDLTQNQVVWFGHSSYLLVLGGKTILVDPVLTEQFPMNLMMKPFLGTDIYSPDDMPDVDLLLITHDHWDHLDYGTLKQLGDRVHNVVAPLGVGAHLEKWGFGDRLTELDWNDSTSIDSLRVTCLPARHFSGRLLKRGQSLWASFMIEGAGKCVYVEGDSGYGKHFAEIGQRFPSIDLLMLEDGQYGKDWANIHTLPTEHTQVIRDLQPKKVVPVHNSKFSLSNHTWDEPMNLIRQTAEADSTLHIEMPTIGKSILIP